ncbi:hypothetical protein D8674_016444 [Pyrus ussuriensis x Pyrus communis]|uniref:Uncharacterized protein n=1 Tax=Pyrus ussuriensis x Pyrus communis TaxID=2448454 RepID=A0A5N5HND4_9ROSA|nr:hypothetical protein D8674_016444 [Pyrus ussuriensis x Pyrus communis]
MSYWSSNSNDFQFFASTVDPMNDRFTSNAQHRPRHLVKFSDEYEERVVESPRTTRRAHVTHYVARDQAEDVDEEAAEFIEFEHKKFLMNQQSMRND